MDDRSFYDVITIGDTMYDVFLQISEAAVSCSLDRTACQIAFAFGEKVPVESVIKIPGAGNASNAAIGAKRLGRKTAIVSIVGNDNIGDLILECWKEASVATDFVRRDHQYESNYSTILNFKGERTILIYHQPFTYSFPELPQAKRIYYTSLGPGHEVIEPAFLAYLSKHPETRVTFQPGTHQLRREAAAYSELLRRCDVLAMNKEEVARFFHLDQATDIAKRLNVMKASGVSIALLTDGENGSYAFDGTNAWYMPIFPGKSLERTGAGDSFTITFTCALDWGFSLPEALRYGTANAWHVIQQIGPQAGLAHREQLERTLRQFADIKAKPFSV